MMLNVPIARPRPPPSPRWRERQRPPRPDGERAPAAGAPRRRARPDGERAPAAGAPQHLPVNHTQERKILTGVCEKKAPSRVHKESHTSPRTPPRFNVDTCELVSRAGSGFYFAVRRDDGLFETQH